MDSMRGELLKEVETRFKSKFSDVQQQLSTLESSNQRASLSSPTNSTNFESTNAKLTELEAQIRGTNELCQTVLKQMSKQLHTFS